MDIKLKIREVKTSKGNVIKKIKFNDLGIDQSVVVEKLYPDIIEKEYSRPDGTKFVARTTMVNYDGENVYVNLSPKLAEAWKKVPVGLVRITKTEETMQLMNGTSRTYTKYLVEPASQQKLIEKPKQEIQQTAQNEQIEIEEIDLRNEPLQLTETQKKILQWLKSSGKTVDAQIKINGEVKTVREVLGEEIVSKLDYFMSVI